MTLVLGGLAVVSFQGDLEVGRELRVFQPEDLSDEAVAICEAQRLFFADPDDWTPECAAYFAGEPITREVVVTAPLFAKENLDSVRTWGAESQLRIQYDDWMRLWLDYTWLNTEVVDSTGTLVATADVAMSVVPHRGTAGAGGS